MFKAGAYQERGEFGARLASLGRAPLPPAGRPSETATDGPAAGPLASNWSARAGGRFLSL